MAGLQSAASPAAAVLTSAIARRVFPGAAVEAGDARRPLWSAAFGTLTFDADADSTGIDTIFDLASLTKPIATTSVVLDLVHQGILSLDRAVADDAPEWRGPDRDIVTIADLLEHASGLSARLLDAPPDGPREFEHEICSMPLDYAPRTRSIYSDLGFILVGFCAQRAGSAPFPAQAHHVIARAVEASGASPASAIFCGTVPRAHGGTVAPTEPLAEDLRRGRRLVGEVHDNYAAALGGFAAHAGLFGNASGVGAFARTVLRAARGESTAPAPFTPSLVARAVQKSRVPGSSRALGWDTMLPTSSCGTRMTPSAFGHVGFTGTSLWIDPERDRYFVLLTNRVCGGGTTEDMQVVRRAFHDALADL